YGPADGTAAIMFDYIRDLRTDTGDDFGGNGLRRFAARVVVGNPQAIGMPSRGRPHQRAFAAVTVAAATEYAVHPTGNMSADGLQRLLQRIRRVRVINHDQRLIGAGRYLLH